jgi:hypothetical protein
MPNLIAIFGTRADAELTTHALVHHGISSEAITFLTPERLPEENHPPVQDDRGIGEALGAYAGGAAAAGGGFFIGATLASLAVPGVGPILAAGVGAAALLGVSGAAIGAQVGNTTENALEHEAAERDVLARRELLKLGRTLLIVHPKSDDEKATVEEFSKRNNALSVGEQVQLQPGAA